MFWLSFSVWKIALRLSHNSPHHPQAGVAQSVEQRTRNAKVVGSIPISGTMFRFYKVSKSRPLKNQITYEFLIVG